MSTDSALSILAAIGLQTLGAASYRWTPYPWNCYAAAILGAVALCIAFLAGRAEGSV